MIKININQTDFTTIFSPVVREISYSGYDKETIAKSPPKSYDVKVIAIKGSKKGFCTLNFSTFCQAVKAAANQLGIKAQSKGFCTINESITIYSTNEAGCHGYLKDDAVDQLFNDHEIYKANSHANFMKLLKTYGIDNLKIILFKRCRIRWLSTSYFEAHLLMKNEVENLIRSTDQSFNDFLILTPRQYKSSDEKCGQLDLFS